MISSSEKSQCNNQPIPLTNRFGIYVHVPFCVHKCSYCDFFSFTQYTESDFQAYTDRVVAEIGQAGEFLYARSGAPSALSSIFFGGGTPSLLPIPMLRKIFDALELYFEITVKTEISLEANPETVNSAFLEGLHGTPANRISLGAQSFRPENLHRLERLGSRESIYRAVELLKQHGFSDFNLDFIFGIPGQTQEHIQSDLQEATRLGPNHVSAYSLSLKPAHPLYAQLPSNDLAADQYEWVTDTLRTLGYPQYEISNYSKRGHECAHNLLYWSGGDFLGVGPSAASRFFWEGSFRHRKAPSDFRKYLHSSFADVPFESSTRSQTILEALFLEIRRNDGIRIDAFQRRYDFDFTAAPKFGGLVQSGHLVYEDGSVRLSDAGRLLAESVVLQLAP